MLLAQIFSLAKYLERYKYCKGASPAAWTAAGRRLA